MFCTKCGTKASGNEKYCTKCGSVLEDASKKSGKSGKLLVAVVAGICVLMAIAAVIVAVVVIKGSKSEEKVAREVSEYTAEDAGKLAADDETVTEGKTSDSDALEVDEQVTAEDSTDKSEAGIPKVDDDVENNPEVATISDEEAKKAMNDLLNELDRFLYILWFGDEIQCDVGQTRRIELDDYQMTRAASVSVKTVLENEFEIDEYEYGQRVDWDSMDESCLRMFGKKANVNSLKNFDEAHSFTDVILFETAPTYIWDDVETEFAYECLDTSIEIDGGDYTASRNMYMGYWGYSMMNKANYRMKVDFEPNSNSSYGIVISGISFERIDDESAWNVASAYHQFDYSEGFYGIWCYASKDETAAYKKADEVREAGFEAQVYISSEWENLNADRYYLVSVGTYENEYEANDMLSYVKAAGYSDAYVKYSGHVR